MFIHFMYFPKKLRIKKDKLSVFIPTHDLENLRTPNPAPNLGTYPTQPK